MKEADAPYEDEPFAFLAVSFNPALGLAPPAARLLADPVIEKGFAGLVVCAPDGHRDERRVLRRDKVAFKAVRHAASGDVFDA